MIICGGYVRDIYGQPPSPRLVARAKTQQASKNGREESSSLWLGAVFLLSFLGDTQIWTASDYEPDKVIASTYFAGALASYKGFVYFGTLNFPGAVRPAFFPAGRGVRPFPAGFPALSSGVSGRVNEPSAVEASHI